MITNGATEMLMEIMAHVTPPTTNPIPESKEVFFGQLVGRHHQHVETQLNMGGESRRVEGREEGRMRGRENRWTGERGRKVGRKEGGETDHNHFSQRE